MDMWGLLWQQCFRLWRNILLKSIFRFLEGSSKYIYVKDIHIIYILHYKSITEYVNYFSATLFYIVKGKEKERICIKLKKKIISALLDAMEAHLGDDTMMRNGCLTLCQFKIPQDVVNINFNTAIWLTVSSYLFV